MKLEFSRTIFNTGALKTRDEHMGTEEDIKFVLIKRERERWRKHMLQWTNPPSEVN